MYYRGDESDFAFNPQVSEPVFDPGFTESIQPYANAPGSAIRAAELAAGEAVANSGFTGGGGFLKQLAEVGSTFGMFFSPLLPILGPALMSTPVVGGAITAAATAAKYGGALRPTIEAITTAPGGTTTERAATGPLFPTPLPVSSLKPPLPSETYYPQAGLRPELVMSARASQLQRAQARPRSRAIRASQRLSRTQQKALSAEVRRLLLQ